MRTPPKKSAKPPAIEFPCDYGLKVVATAQPQIEVEVLAIINQFGIAVDKNAIKQTSSKQANYISITLVLKAVQNREQLEAICTALRAHEHVQILI